jgi:hypothetical protein
MNRQPFAQRFTPWSCPFNQLRRHALEYYLSTFGAWPRAHLYHPIRVCYRVGIVFDEENGMALVDQSTKTVKKHLYIEPV